MDIHIDQGGDVPIYQQLVDAIQSQIDSGALPEAQKLPTVRQLAEQLSLAKGTINPAYDELERRGAVRMTQGRGPFVLPKLKRSDRPKQPAMLAIV